ncbi:MAG: Ig-like domain-containing protein, partial [Clostridia bacterium]|nr:Ig-like domain-containing protein [Clostridia bacterium]
STGVPVNTGIEFEFTSQIKGGTDISKYVTVSPNFEYKAELYPNGRRLVLIPQKKLDKNTEYTVTLKKGFPSASGEVLREDITLRFRTEATSSAQNDRKYYLSLSPTAITAKSGDNAVYGFSFYANKGVNAEITDVKAEIYEYRNHTAMLNAVKEFNEKGADLIANGAAYKYPTSGLAKISSGSVEYASSGARQYYAYLPTLDDGAYLVNITVSVKHNGTTVNETAQLLLQVSELAAYFESTEGELIIWGVKNGLPVDNVSVSAEFFERHTDFSLKNDKSNYTKLTAKTGTDGIARIETPQNATGAICLLEKGGDSLLIFPGSLDEYVTDKSYGYVFTDREVYFGDDTVSFSGAIIPVNGEIPQKLWLRVNYRGAKYPVTVNADGSFEGSYMLEGFSGYGVTLHFIDENGSILLSKYVRITAEDKPVYTASLSFDKIFYESSDTAKITVTASFFDGTPASGLKFRIYARVPGSNKSFDVTTGSDGTATVSYKLPSPDVSSTSPTYVSASAELMGTETAYIYTSASATYIHSDFYFTSETASDNGASYSRILLNRVDTSAIKSAADLNYSVFPANTVGKPMDGDARVTLTKVTYVRRSLGTEYDPINKITYERYSYDRHEETLKTEVRTFNDGVIRLEHLDDSTFNGYYYYTVTYGKYTLRVNASSRNVDSYDYSYSGLMLESDKEYYTVGDTIKYTVAEYPAQTDTARTYLVTVYYGDTCEHFVTDSPKFEIPYTAEMIPGVCVNVTVAESGSFTLLRSTPRYDHTANNALKVEIIPEKTEYKPGDEVKVTVKVTDKNGSPAKAGTRVTLSVVDEACFALGEQNLDILSDLFGTFTPPHNNRNASFSLFYAYNLTYYLYSSDVKLEAAEDSAMTEAPTAGANGATDEVRVRKYFADNPVYETKLSANGTAEFTFTAPDNITEWRLTAGAAYTAENAPETLLAGNAYTDVISTLPFFINAGYLESYIAGDDITCSARVHGKDVSGSFDTVAAIYGADGKLIKSVSAHTKAGEFAYFSFGKLDIGEYVLRITCTAKGAGDAVEYPFSVVESAVLATTERLLNVSEISTVSPAKYPVVLSFVNREQRAFTELAQMLAHTGSTRSDAIAASIAAEELLAAFIGTNSSTATLKSTLNSRYLNGDLISLLPYSSGELKLSALIAACCSNALTRSTLDTLSQAFYSYAGGKCTEEE